MQPLKGKWNKPKDGGPDGEDVSVIIHKFMALSGPSGATRPVAIVQLDDGSLHHAELKFITINNP